jgi:hypothetical protein
MINGDPLATNTVTVQPNEVVQTNGDVIGTPQKKSGGFWSVLGKIGQTAIGVLSGGGIASVIPSLLGGGNGYIGSMQAMMNDGLRSQSQLLLVQQKISRQSEEFAAITNLMKSRHDSEMQAVNNFKS